MAEEMSDFDLEKLRAESHQMAALMTTAGETQAASHYQAVNRAAIAEIEKRRAANA